MAALTKNELIELLQKIPGNPKVLVNAYESGLSDLTAETVYEEFAVLNRRDEDGYSGRHCAFGQEGFFDLDDFKETKEEHQNLVVEKVILLSRYAQTSALYEHEKETLNQIIKWQENL